jgi:hypothetical protein
VQERNKKCQQGLVIAIVLGAKVRETALDVMAWEKCQRVSTLLLVGHTKHAPNVRGVEIVKPVEAQVNGAEHSSAIDSKRVAQSVEEWLKEKRQPHPLEAELTRIQKVLDALEECPPLWWADKLLWKGLWWYYRMQQQSNLIHNGQEKLT